MRRPPLPSSFADAPRGEKPETKTETEDAFRQSRVFFSPSLPGRFPDSERKKKKQMRMVLFNQALFFNQLTTTSQVAGSAFSSS